MTTARLRTIQLSESVQQTRGKLVVDRNAGVIRNVKYLGTESPNRHGQEGVDGTEYTRDAIRESRERYNGRQVFLDHPAGRNATAERSVRDLAGVIRECRDEADGGFCELHYVKGTPNGELLATIAETHPELIGLSHNADGKGRRDAKRKKYVIESIPNVRSVDVVTRPATTSSLYESQESGMTLKQIIENLKLGATAQAATVKLLEDEGGMTMDAAPPAAVAGDWRAKLSEAIVHIVQDPDLDEAAVKAKVMAVLKLLSEEKKAEETTDSGTEPPTETKESRELATYRKEKAVRTLCESLKFAPTEAQIGILAKLEDAERKELIDTFKGTVKTPNAPRSNGARPLTESKGQDVDNAAWLRRLKSRAN